MRGTGDLWKVDFYQVDNMEDLASGASHIGTFVTENGAPDVRQA